MLRSLIKGVGMGAGMSIGQEIAGSLINNRRNRRHQGTVHRDVRCGACGEINTWDSKFCGACGNSFVVRCDLQQGVACSCGFINARGQRFCSECGTGLA